MTCPKKRGLLFGLFFLGLSLTLSSNVFAEDVRTEIFQACEEGKERVRFSEVVESADAGPIEDAIEDGWAGSRMFQLAHKVAAGGKTVELKEFGEYLKARAYFREGLYHIAYDKFSAFLAKPMTANHPLAARMGALQCLIQIQKKVTTLGFTKEVVAQIMPLVSRKDVTSLDLERLGHALVVRTKALVNEWEPTEVDAIVKAIAPVKQYAQYANALLIQRHGQYSKVIPLWEKILEQDELPKTFEEDRDTLLIMYARDLYETKKYEKAADILRKVPRESNYLAQALSDLSWSLLMAGKRPEAIGAAFNIQKSLLTRVYAPEAPLVASIALHEMCQYARALKNAVFFKKKYLPVLLWYRKLTPQQQARPYQLLTNALRRKGGVPNIVLLEWLRSPEYRSFQNEANLYFEEKKTAYRLYSERLNAEKFATWVREWKQPLPKFYNEVDKNQKQLTVRMNQVLAFITNRMTRQVARMNENVQLLEVEIFDAAGEDMVWRNVNPEYAKWTEEQEPETRAKDLYWEWGSIPVDPKSKDEVWEDELGWTLGSVSDECMMKRKFKDFKGGKAISTNSTPAQPQ